MSTNHKKITSKIFCTSCGQTVSARLTNGRERYPHRPDLAQVPFYTHDKCNSWVGTHRKTKQPYRPLGVLADEEMMVYRKRIHELLDPIWQSGVRGRGQIYRRMSREMGVESYHTGELRSLEEARKAWRIAQEIHTEAALGPLLSINIRPRKRNRHGEKQ